MGKTPKKRELYAPGKKFYMHPLPSNYKETGLLEDLNDGMEWVIIDYGRYLKQAK